MQTVRDIMQSNVVTVRPDTPVREVARILTEARISGLPVVEESGRIAGVVSSTDLLRLAARSADLQLEQISFPGDWGDMSNSFVPDEDGGTTEGGFSDDAGAPWLALTDSFDWSDQRDTGETLVGDVMTGAYFTIDADASVAEFADFLLKGRIHRALVVEEDRLVAIVTSFDVLRAVAAS